MKIAELIFNKNSLLLILLIIIWRAFLELPDIVGGLLLREHPGYIGPIHFANLDGKHYLNIAQYGYQEFQQAFFPLFPFLINIASRLFQIPYLYAANILVYLSLFFALFFFWKLVEERFGRNVGFRAVIFLLAFPTAFFLGAIYTESLFLCFVFASFFFAKKEKYFLSGVFGFLASATRFVGIFLLPAILLDIYLQKKSFKKMFTVKFLPLLLIPLGLLTYMYYLAVRYKDPLMFIHAQSAFGAGRSSGEIILLPQVLVRYVKILATIPITNHDFYTALLELVSFFVVLFLLLLSFRKKLQRGLILFGFLSIMLPTLSGTLSSLPRYSLSAFVIFIYLATIESKFLGVSILLLGLLLEFILAMYFLQGYFIS